MKFITTAQQNKGFSIIELIVALGVSSVLIVSAFGIAMLNSDVMSRVESKDFLLRAMEVELEGMRQLVESSEYGLDSGVTAKSSGEIFQTTTISWIDTFTQKVALEYSYGHNRNASIVHEEYFSFPMHSSGQDMCSPFYGKLWDNLSSRDVSVVTLISLGTGQVGTDIYVRNGVAYLSSDSATQSHEDIHIYDVHSTTSVTKLSSLNTGAGIRSLAVAGNYVFAANTNISSQIQVIDISQPENPRLVHSVQVPLPTPTTTPPISSAIAFYNGRIYLGTEKWEGPEFMIFNAYTPMSLIYEGGFETNTLVNDIHVYKSKAFIAASDGAQMRVIDVSNPALMVSLEIFSPTGHEVQEGKRVEQVGDALYLTRTVGGFNNIKNHEIFSMDIMQPSITTSLLGTRDVPNGVYGIHMRGQGGMIAVGKESEALQILRAATSSPTWDVIDVIPLPYKPVRLQCDGSRLYAVLNGHAGFSIITLKNL